MMPQSADVILDDNADAVQQISVPVETTAISSTISYSNDRVSKSSRSRIISLISRLSFGLISTSIGNDRDDIGHVNSVNTAHGVNTLNGDHEEVIIEEHPHSPLPTSPNIVTYAQSLSTNAYGIANDVVAHHVQRIHQCIQQALLYPLTISYTRRHYYTHIMEVASSYEQWSSAALALDELDGNSAWKQDPCSKLYDHKLIRERLRSLNEARESGDISALTFLLRTSLSRNLGDMGNPSLYAQCHIGTKELIETYNGQVVKCLELICDTELEPEEYNECDEADDEYEDLEKNDLYGTDTTSHSTSANPSSTNQDQSHTYLTNTWTAAVPYTDWLEGARMGTQVLTPRSATSAGVHRRRGKDRSKLGLDERQKMEFFLNTRQSFGRTALLLSGGATLSLHHIGVIKGLWEAKLLPRIISGASGGSIIASFVCTHTEDEFERMLNPAYTQLHIFEDSPDKDLYHHISRFFNNGVLFDVDALINTLHSIFGDITFQEAYNRTRRILNIAVSSSTVYEMPRLLNYLTAPNVFIWSAVAASCAVPFVFRAAPLMAKDKSGKPVPWNPSGHRWIDGSLEGDLPMQKLTELFNVNHFIVCQVNPHVVPFLHKGLVKSYFRQACESALSFSRSELNLRCNQLKELGVLPELLYRVQSIVSQKYIGDITIIPDIQVSDYLRMLSNPSAEELLMATLKGEQATWPKISIVQNHLQIEMALDRMLYKCRMRSLLNPQRTLRGILKRLQATTNTSEGNSSGSNSSLSRQHLPDLVQRRHIRTATNPHQSSASKLRKLLIPNGWNNGSYRMNKDSGDRVQFHRYSIIEPMTAPVESLEEGHEEWTEPLTARSADGMNSEWPNFSRHAPFTGYNYDKKDIENEQNFEERKQEKDEKSIEISIPQNWNTSSSRSAVYRSGSRSGNRDSGCRPMSKSVVNLPSYLQDWYHQGTLNQLPSDDNPEDRDEEDILEIKAKSRDMPA